MADLPDERDARIAQLETQLAESRALNDRIRLALIHLRDQLDLAIAQAPEEPGEAEHG